MTARVDHESSFAADDGQPAPGGTGGRAGHRLRALTDLRPRLFRVGRPPVRPTPAGTVPAPAPVPLPERVPLPFAAAAFAPPVRLPRSDVVRSACGLPSFLGLLSLDGTLLEFNHTATTPPERDLQHAVDRPFWDATWWSWSPLVQHRLRTAVAHVAGGGVLRYPETALVRHNQLITMELAWAPLASAGVVTGVICSAVEITGRDPAGLAFVPL